MSLTKLTATMALLCAVLCVHANDSTSFFSRIANFPGKFLDKVSSRTSHLDQQLTSKTEKYLERLAKREAKLRKKLLKYDSAGAQSLLSTNPVEEYARMMQKMKTDTAASAKYMGPEYLPYVDSLQVSLAFLHNSPDVLNNSKILPVNVQQSISQLSQLQAKMQDADALKAFVQARKEQLRAYILQCTNLPPGVSGMYNDYNKQLYYYSQQVRAYREMLNDPDKMTKTALMLLNKLPAFADFMKRNSFLAGMFSMPDNYGAASTIGGFQTRDQVLSIIQAQIGQGGASATSAVQQSLQAAQQDIAKIQNKLGALGSGSNSMDIPDFKVNSQKTKTVFQRLQFGTNMQTAHGTYYFPTTTDLGLSAGYLLNDKNIIGIGASYKIGWGKDFSHIHFSSQGIAMRSFVDIKMKKSFYATGGLEYNYQQPIYSISQLYLIHSWQQSGLIGISKLVSMKTKVFKSTKVQVLWDFLSYQQIPRTQPFKFRVGYNF